MRFFTPEWDYTSRRTSLGFNLHADKCARVFDESFYNRAYQQAHQSEYRMMKGVHEVSHTDLITRLHKPFYDAGEMSAEEFENAMEDARRRDAEKPPFSEEAVMARCQMRLQNTQKSYQRLLPAEILDQVADIRVLAAGVASPEVYKAIKAFSAENDRLFHQIHEAHAKQINSIWGKIPKEIRENLFSLHDATLERAEIGERVLTLFLKQDCENYHRIRNITFEDCEILHIDEPVDDGWWKYVEFDILEDGRFEVGILFTGATKNEDGDWFHQTIEVRSPKITFARDEFTEEEIEAQRVMQERLERLEQKGLVKRIALLKLDETD